MRDLKKLFAVAFAIVSFGAFAVSRSFTGTVDTPTVPTWVDSSSNTITPYITLGTTGPLYIDSSTGYVWTIQNVLTSPSATGLPIQGMYYTTVNCTGTVYIIVSTSDIPNIVHTGPSAGDYYVAGSAYGGTVYSQLLNGTCYSDTETTNIYVATGPLTAPTLTAAPWHLENR